MNFFYHVSRGFIGNEIHDNNGNIIGVNVIRIIYDIDSNHNREVSNAFDEAFIEYWKENRHKYEYFDVVMYSNGGHISELNRSVKLEIPFVVISFGIMMIYLMLTMGGFSCIKARPMLGMSAVLLVALVLFSSVAISSYIGAKFYPLIMGIAFILIGVGVDVCLMCIISDIISM